MVGGPRVLAFGNNLCGNLQHGGPPILKKPTEVKYECDTVEWASWTCTIGRDPLQIWGSDPLILNDIPAKISLAHTAKRVIGFDQPAAFLLKDGRVQHKQGRVSADAYDEVVVTGLGTVYACKSTYNSRRLSITMQDDQLFRFESLEDLMQGTNRFGLVEGFPHCATTKQLVATESRAFILVNGPAPLLYEIKDVRSLPPKSTKSTDPVILQYVTGFEVAGKLALVPGCGNRLGVVTELGEAYILPPTRERELILFDDEDVRLMGLGVDSEIVVTDRNIYVRGSTDKQINLDN
uniref:Uncharacterized protein n=1 Tax=Kwoniella dejecticola CBS 10117 TaxID=1296121 RepID=A0A1A5ZZG5_9TREE|nr:uncharacterized protein I303_06758 [Kwoniella dejecticola CBS 10117]OBR83199.1 hypothetical protein I303_06758 [Kwoniella dejecticola CBS 10117]